MVSIPIASAMALLAYAIHAYKRFFRGKGKAKPATLNLNASTVVLDIEEAIDEDSIQKYVESHSGKEVLDRVKTRAADYCNGNHEDPITVLEIYKTIELKKDNLTEITQCTAIRISEEILRLQNRLEPLSELCKETYGEIQKSIRLAPRHNILRVQKICKVLRNFVQNCEENKGSASYVYMFHYVPSGDVKEDERRMATFDALYDEVYSNIALKSILTKIEFDFERFEALKEPIEDARKQLADAEKEHVIAGKNRTLFLNGYYGDSNIQLVLKAAEEYNAILAVHRSKID